MSSAQHRESELELSVVMPCLNEADTLETCIGKAQRVFAEQGLAAEVVVADNGSTDGSVEIAERMGARIVHVEERGYGSALMGGIAAARGRYALGLRLTVALAVGVAIVIGVWRILSGWPIHLMIAGGYLLVVIMTAFAPEEIIGIAYDSGGITTSTITVPLVTALGVGLASSIEGRNPVSDGFGLIAFASLTPMIFVMLYGMLI